MSGPQAQFVFPFDGSSEVTATAAVDKWSKSVKVEENAYYWHGDPVVIPPTLKIPKGTPTIAELFSGAGGTSVGFEMAGYQVAVGADLHGPSVQTFRRNHPGAGSILGDLRRVEAGVLSSLLGRRRTDVLIAGVPCQGFSLNNRKRHDGDERNELYREFVRFVREVQPRAVVLENVSGMRSAAGGEYVRLIESELSKATGMVVTSAMLKAQDYGVPQKRARLVFVGVAGDEPFDMREIKKTHGPGTGRPFTTVWDAISDLPSLEPGEGSEEYACAPQSAFQRLMRRGAGKKLMNHVAPNHPEETIERIRRTKPGAPMYPKFKQRIRLSWEGMSPTQVSGGIRPQFQFGHPEDARGLSIRERCRLQSFPDSFEVTGGIVQGRVQTGNAVPPLLARAVALAIKERL